METCSLSKRELQTHFGELSDKNRLETLNTHGFILTRRIIHNQALEPQETLPERVSEGI